MKMSQCLGYSVPIFLSNKFGIHLDAPGFSVENCQNIPMLPGLYLIYCLENQRFYVGESTNVSIRLGQHYRELKEQTHFCSALLADWQRLEPEQFIFLILDAGPGWSETGQRKAKETEIVQLNQARVYNQISIRNFGSMRPVLHNQTLYASVSEASRKTKISPTQLRRYLTNPGNKEWVYADVFGDFIGSGSAKSVSVNGIVYRSVRNAAINMNIDRKTLRNILTSGKDPNIFWVNQEGLEESS